MESELSSMTSLDIFGGKYVQGNWLGKFHHSNLLKISRYLIIRLLIHKSQAKISKNYYQLYMILCEGKNHFFLPILDFLMSLGTFYYLFLLLLVLNLDKI